MLKQFCMVFFVLFGCYIEVNSKELKHIIIEVEVHAPASEVWELYRNLGIAKLAAQQLTDAIQSLEVLRGDGGIGTIIKFTFVPGNSSYTEKFTEIDDRTRVKVTRGLEGDCLAIGCSVQIIQYDIIEKSKNSSIIRVTISYAVKKQFEANDPKPNVELVAAITQVAKEFLEANNNA